MSEIKVRGRFLVISGGLTARIEMNPNELLIIFSEPDSLDDVIKFL